MKKLILAVLVLLSLPLMMASYIVAILLAGCIGAFKRGMDDIEEL